MMKEKECNMRIRALRTVLNIRNLSPFDVYRIDR